MIINDKQAVERLSSPLNLINRMRAASSSGNGKGSNGSMSLFGLGRKQETEAVTDKKIGSFNPFRKKEEQVPPIIPQVSTQEVPSVVQSAARAATEPSLSSLLQNSESQIKLGLAHDNAIDLLNNSVTLLRSKIEEVKADKLPAVISAASKVVESIRRERLEASQDRSDREVHYHFYTPIQKKLADYEVIEVQ